MHMWDWFGWGGMFWPGMFFMGIPFLFLIGIALLFVLLLSRTGGTRSYRPSRGTSPSNLEEDSAIRILRERFARGEIDEEEYRQRRAALETPET